MAKYRQVHIEFWQDGFVLDLTPEEKYFYLYLMTNSKTSQCGIYELPKRIIETETGYNRETVDKLLQRFIDYGKILYDDSTKEIILLNWAKYNMIKSPKVISCIKKELGAIKNNGFIHEFINNCNQLGYVVDFFTSGNQGSKIEEPANNELSSEPEDAIKFYQENFGLISPYIAECVDKWETDIGPTLVIEAMKRALKKQKMWSYAEGILKTWVNRNVRTMEDVMSLDKEFESRGENNGNQVRRGSASKSPKASESESITGNQVGWIGRKQNSVQEMQ